MKPIFFFHSKISESANAPASYMDHHPHFTWIADADGNIVFANKALLNFFRLDRRVFGKNINGHLPSPVARIIGTKHRLAIRDNQPDQSILKFRMSDGKEHSYKVLIFPMRVTSRGSMVGGDAREITPEILDDNEEREASQRLHYISRAASDAIWDWNMVTGRIYFNEALHNLVGTNPGQVFDLNWCYQRIHEEDLDKVSKSIGSALGKKEQSWQVEYRFRCLDGRFKMMYNRGIVIYENQEAIRMVVCLQDVYEIRQLESQLVNQKLRQQKGITEAIIRAQEAERARIGHELHDNVNQILYSGQLHLSLLTEGMDQFEVIKEKTMGIVKLAIEEIRKLARGMVNTDFKEGGLVAGIRELVGELRFIGLFKICFMHSEIAEIEKMSQQKKITLFRIVQEQSKNIIRHSKASNVEISLHASTDQVRLEIRDDGRGFDKEKTCRGLGLANIYERTRLYNGRVLISTKPGCGCSIVINLPLDEKDQQFQ